MKINRNIKNKIIHYISALKEDQLYKPRTDKDWVSGVENQIRVDRAECVNVKLSKIIDYINAL